MHHGCASSQHVFPLKGFSGNNEPEEPRLATEMSTTHGMNHTDKQQKKPPVTFLEGRVDWKRRCLLHFRTPEKSSETWLSFGHLSTTFFLGDIYVVLHLVCRMHSIFKRFPIKRHGWTSSSCMSLSSGLLLACMVIVDVQDLPMVPSPLKGCAHLSVKQRVLRPPHSRQV